MTGGVLATWPALQVLELHGSHSFRDRHLELEGSVVLAAAAPTRLPALLRLNVGLQGIEFSGVQALMQTTWQRLRTLDLHNSELGPESGAALALACRAGRLPELRQLDLHLDRAWDWPPEAELGDAGVVALVQCTWPRLEVLNLGGQRFGLAAMTAMGFALGAARFPSLRELHLGSKDVGAHSMRSLLRAPWPCLASVTFSDACGSILCAATLVKCAAALPALRSLEFVDCELGFRGATALALGLARGAWPQLKQCSFTAGAFGGEGKVALKVAGAARTLKVFVKGTLQS